MPGVNVLPAICLLPQDNRFCNKPVQAAKETAGGGLMKNRRDYRNKRLAETYRPNLAAYCGLQRRLKGLYNQQFLYDLGGGEFPTIGFANSHPEKQNHPK